jgi:hypothetical protein
VNRKITRRAIAKLLAAAPIAFAIPEAALPADRKKGGGPPLTEKQRKAIAKGSGELKKALAALHKMPIPMGTEPAFVFSAVPSKK